MRPEQTAAAHPNIAFIKYWGNRDDALRLPSNGSISMNLSGMETRTSVRFDPELQQDCFTLNGEAQVGAPLQRVSQFLEHVRKLSGSGCFARVSSSNHFPTGAGIASSASAFSSGCCLPCSAFCNALINRLINQPLQLLRRQVLLVAAQFFTFQAGIVDHDGT